MDIFQIDKISLFIIFIIPGFISMKIWGFMVPTKTRNMNEIFLDVITYSCLNFTLTSWLIVIIGKEGFQKEHFNLFVVCLLLILFVFPIVWPVLLRFIVQTKYVSKRVLHFIPSAWDFHFNKGEQQYVLIHLTDGHKIGGLWGFSSSYPNPEDIYISFRNMESESIMVL
jgi:hypothetical protein